MTELPEEVARELEELFGKDDVPEGAITVRMLMKEKGLSGSTWRHRLAILIDGGTWARGKRAGSAAYWYWRVDEGD